jgi:glyoxylase-like metal-dependent hydrolase (beta-lactamase superfamily II)
VERERLEPAALLTTHAHGDHIAGDDRLRQVFPELETVAAVEELHTAHFDVESLPTPGHSDDMVAFVVNREAVFTGDTLFKDSVGGGSFDEIRRSVMDVLMGLPQELRALPGHTDETTIGREWEENPFIRVWRGIEPEGTERVRVTARDATLVVWSPDYDGSGKAWVRFEDDGRDAIVGGSRVERLD